MRVFIFFLMTFVTFPAAAQDLVGQLRGDGAGYAQVVPGKQLKFPRDHGPHPDYRIEWWYMTANLVDDQNRDWGLQWTLFRQALSPEAVDSGWQSNQIWMAHTAITTPEGHFHEQRYARGGIGQAGVTRIDRDGFFNAWIDNWQWRSQGDALFPGKLEFTVDDWDVEIALDTAGQLVANGVDGYSQKSAQGQASYYYSQPHIRVRGTASRDSARVKLNGVGWLDREWSSQALADNQHGWDWFSLHLEDGNKLMIYRLRHDDGKHWLSGNWIDTEGNSTLLQGNAIEMSPQRIGKIETGKNQDSELPMEWYINLPGMNRSWHIRPLYDQQWMETNYPYWEGVVLVEDDQGSRTGVGYMELTGYQ